MIWGIGLMVKPEGLKCRLECMIKMKPQANEQCNVNKGIEQAVKTGIGQSRKIRFSAFQSAYRTVHPSDI